MNAIRLARRRNVPRPAARRAQPRLEAVEDRLLLSTVAPGVLGPSRSAAGQEAAAADLSITMTESPDPAQDVRNYKIQAPGQGSVPIGSVSYDPVARSVTIRPVHRIDIHYPFTLVTNGRPPDGLTDTAGNFRDGAGDGQSGTDYHARVVWYGSGARVTPVQPATTIRAWRRSPPPLPASNAAPEPLFSQVARGGLPPGLASGAGVAGVCPVAAVEIEPRETGPLDRARERILEFACNQSGRL